MQSATVQGSGVGEGDGVGVGAGDGVGAGAGDGVGVGAGDGVGHRRRHDSTHGPNTEIPEGHKSMQESKEPPGQSLGGEGDGGTGEGGDGGGGGGDGWGGGGVGAGAGPPHCSGVPITTSKQFTNKECSGPLIVAPLRSIAPRQSQRMTALPGDMLSGMSKVVLAKT